MLKREISLQVICEKVKFLNWEFCNNFGLNIFISLIQIDMQDIYTYNSNL